MSQFLDRSNWSDGGPWTDEAPPRGHENYKRSAAKSLRFIPPPKVDAWLKSQDAIDVAKEFRRLTKQMEGRLGPTSRLREWLFSEEYVAIVGLGPRVVPHLLVDLRKHVRPWFFALRALTRQDPTVGVSPGNFEELARHWVAWGVEQEII